MGIFFSLFWLLFPFLGAQVEGMPITWEVLAFTAILYFLLVFNVAFSPVNFMKQTFASIERSRRKKEYKWLCDEIEEFRYLRAKKIVDETFKLISNGSAVKENAPAVHYNLARAYSVYGKPEEALLHLQKVIDSGYLDLAKVQEDVDLAGLRLTKEFQRFKENRSVMIGHTGDQRQTVGKAVL